MKIIISKNENIENKIEIIENLTNDDLEIYESKHNFIIESGKYNNYLKGILAELIKEDLINKNFIKLIYK
jgi:hypothetical protein